MEKMILRGKKRDRYLQRSIVHKRTEGNEAKGFWRREPKRQREENMEKGGAW